MKGEKFCPNCEDYQKMETVEKEEVYIVRGQRLPVWLRTQICHICGEQSGSDKGDQKTLNAVYTEYRKGLA